MYTLYLVHWNDDEAKPLARNLTDMGYRIEYGPFDPHIFKQLLNDPPDILLIDLDRKPSGGRDVGLTFRTRKPLRHVPIIFIGGAPDKVEKIRELLPDALYTDWANISESLKIAVEAPPVDPVVPKSVMSGYSGTPLPKKLGIKAGATVTLINAPDDFETTLGELPENVTLQSGMDKSGNVTLWFVDELVELKANIDQISELHGDSKLWICWCKQSSGVKTDVNSNEIRSTGLDAGLVDYKVASIDSTWSGFLFARKKGD